MRMRNDQLRTGRAFTWVDETNKSKPRVLLFLVRGAEDIAPLSALQSVCDSWVNKRGRKEFSWHPVADPGQISSVDPRLSSADIHRFEVCEFQNLDAAQLACLLGPIIEHIAAGDTELLPRVGGAVGAPAEGIQFLNRSAEVGQLKASIREGRSVFLQAPRRMGKTSLMRRVQGELEREFTTLALNLERAPTPAECAAQIRSVHSGEGFQTALRVAKSNPNQVLADSLNDFCESSDNPVVLFIDELVALFTGLKEKHIGEEARASEVLSFLTALSSPLEVHGARLIIAGSVDWQAYLESELQINQDRFPGIFSRLEKLPVRPLNLEHPECELRRLLLGSELVAEPADVQWLLEHVDLILPYPAVKFLDSVLAKTKQGGAIDRSALDALLSGFLKNTDSFSDFGVHLRDRCPVRGGVERVTEALSRMASQPIETGISQSELRDLLSDTDSSDSGRLEAWLLETFPVERKEDRVRIASRLFHQWWQTQIAEEGGRND